MINPITLFISKPRKFKPLFCIFFVIFFGLVFSGFNYDAIREINQSPIIWILTCTAMSVVGGIVCAAFWMLFSKMVRVYFH